MDICRHTAGIDRKLVVEVGKISRGTVDCASDKDTGAKKTNKSSVEEVDE